METLSRFGLWRPSFNSLFEMRQHVFIPYQLLQQVSFNSLFEMPVDTSPAQVERMIAFNSLFEMPHICR